MECAVVQYWWKGGGKCSECRSRETVRLDRSEESVTVEREEDIEYEWEQEDVSLVVRWARCEVDQQRFFDMNGAEVKPKKTASGVPKKALPQQLWKGWAGDRQGSSHPNQRFLEKLEFCATQADPVTMKHQATDFCAVLWFHEAQRKRARDVLGKDPPLAQGPAPNFDVEVPETMEGLFEPHRLSETYLRRVKQQQQLCRQIGDKKRWKENHLVKLKEVEGGSQGVSYGVEARKEKYRHLIFQNVDGRPVVVRETLPDQFTDMDLDALLRLAVSCRAPDMGIISEIALYGMRSETACQPTTASWPLYKGGLENIVFLQKNRDAQLTGYLSPRVTKPSWYPRYEPERIHPKGVVKVLKEDGAEKTREVTDYAAERLSVSDKWQQDRVWFLSTWDKRKEADKSWMRLRNRALKGQPGLDSYNANIDKERIGDVQWGKISDFAESIDILLSSGVPVDVKSDDFQAFFPQFPLWVMEQWMATQLLDERGSETNLRPDFGAGHLPPKTSRYNYAVTYCIDWLTWRKQLEGSWSLEPWNREWIQMAEIFMQSRREAGRSGKFWSPFGWIDDNSFGSLRVFTATATRVRYDVWRQLVLIWDGKKSTLYRFGDQIVPPVIGLELRVHERRTTLPDSKRQKYMEGGLELCANAEKDPRDLVQAGALECWMGRAIHASDVFIEIWIYFMELLGELTGDFRRLLTHIPVSKHARFQIRAICEIIRTAEGRPSTSYILRPGSDGLPVWLTWADAARNTKTFFGAVGAFFHLYDDEDVYFFAEQLPVDLVRRADIGQMEMHANSVAAHMQMLVEQKDERWLNVGSVEPTSYLIQTGDSQSVSRHVLNSLRARSPGMRPLAAQRWVEERRLSRLLCGVWVPREENTAADALCNLNLQAFIEQMMRRYSADISMCRLKVPDNVLISDELLTAVRRGKRKAEKRD